MKMPALLRASYSSIIGVGALLLLIVATLASAASYSALPFGRNNKQTQIPPPVSARPDSPLLDSLLHSTPLLRRIADNPQYELQIIYTQINRDAQNRPTFTEHTYHLNPRQYFNPASLVKLPVCLLSLEKLNDLQKPGLTRRSIMATGTAFRCQTAVPFATPADSDHTATVGNYIKRMLLVSDNVAYNRLYEFLGQRPLNQRLQQLGYPNARITRRFTPCDTAANRHTNPITFFTTARDTIYHQPAQTNPTPYSSPLGPVRKGRAYQAGGRIINKPYDFTTANHLPLADITALLRTTLFPETVPTAQRPHLTPSDYAFLRHYLHATPHESGFSFYRSPRYFDAYKKYLYYGRNPDNSQEKALHIYNIVGMSHGYLADVAYFADSLHQTEFLLSAVLYVNQDGILNDGAYEYDTIGQPFLAQLGHLIRQYESQRPRQAQPDLTEFFPAEQVR
jgi:hypothetical protein